MFKSFGTCCIVACMLVFSGAQAQADYPTKPIKIVVPFTAGGLLDTTARTYGAEISEQLGVPVVVENRVGGAGTIATKYVANSEPDGYTLLVGSVVTHAMNPHLLKSIPYDALEDFQPIGMLGANGNVLLVKDSFPAESLQEFFDYVKDKKGAVNYASASVGSSAHLATELLRNKVDGLEYTHIPYNGPSEAMVALMGGHVDFMFANIGPALPQIAAGQIKPLAVTTKVRVAQLPDTPTVAESGVPGFEVVGWITMFAPSGTPQVIVDRLNAIVNKAQTDVGPRQIMEAAAMTPMIYSPKESESYIAEEYVKWGEVINSANLPKN